MSFASIPDQSSVYYNQSFQTIVWLSNSTSVGPIFFSYLGVIIVDIDLSLALLLSNLFNVFGFTLRWIGGSDFRLALAGQVIGSISQIFYQTGSIAISEQFFPKSQEFFIINV